MTSTDSYTNTIHFIDNELSEDEVEGLKFLCEPSIPKSKLKSISHGRELLKALESCNKWSEDDVYYLCELLLIIGRLDLVAKLDHSALKKRRETSICPFRVLLFKINEELDQEEVKTLRFLYGKVPKKEMVKNSLDLFSYMIKQMEITPNNITRLQTLIADIKRNDLLELLVEYENKHILNGYSWNTEQSIPISSPVNQFVYNYIDPVYESASYQETLEPNITEITAMQVSKEDSAGDEISNSDNNHYQSYLDEEMNVSHRTNLFSLEEPSTMSMQASEESVSSVNMIVESEPLEYYKMDALPRGICLIIDNQKFSYNPDDPHATQLCDRVGSEKDSEALKRTFEALNFIVELNLNLQAHTMLEVFKQASQAQHRNFDCFVCCILSHGGEGFVYGTDGHKIPIKRIIEMFRIQNCPQLAGKPKLFFLQCCRGKEHQQAFLPPEIETDTPLPEAPMDQMIPNEADFLFGYATVADAVSYRSKSAGTFYINELTRVLNEYARRYDLLTLLTLVNQGVSKRVFSEIREGRQIVYKQVPAPQYTLLKMLKFF